MVLTTWSYSVGSSTLVVTLSLSGMVVAHQTARREATWALTQGIASVSISLFYHIHDVAYCGGSKDHGDPSHKVGQVWDNESYVILILALDSIYLNLYDDVANGQVRVFPRPVQMTHLPMSSERGLTSRESFSELWCDSVDQCAIV